MSCSAFFQRAAADVAAKLHGAEISDIDWRSVRSRSDDDVLDIAGCLDISLTAHEVFGIVHFKDFSADIVVRAHDGILDIGNRNAVSLHLVRINIHLILPDVSTDRCNLSNSLHTLQVQLHVPILNRAERAKVVLPFECVPEDVSDTGTIGSELHL